MVLRVRRSVLRVWSQAAITPSRLKSRYTRRVRLVCLAGGVGVGVGVKLGVGVAVGDGVAVGVALDVEGSWARAAAGAVSANARPSAGPVRARIMRTRTHTILPLERLSAAIMPPP